MSARDPGAPELSQSQIDGRDFAAEVASGGEGARQNRFLVGERDPALAKKKEDERNRNQLLTILHTIATTEHIAAVRQSLFDLQDRLDHAFAELEEQREELDDRAARLEDGTAIYRMADGRFTTADGRIIEASELPDDIPENAATYEEWQELMRRADQLAGIQTDVIDRGHETLNKDDVTVGELEKLERDIQRAERELDGRTEHPSPSRPDPTPEETPTVDTSIGAPSF